MCHGIRLSCACPSALCMISWRYLAEARPSGKRLRGHVLTFGLLGRCVRVEEGVTHAVSMGNARI